MRGPERSCALVVLSCDAYRDLWPACLELHRRYWPDCPYPRVLVSETIPFVAEFGAAPPPRSIRVGAGLTWSQLVASALRQIDEEYVLLMLDDFFLTRAIDSAAVEALRRDLVALGGAYLRLGSRPRPTRAVPGFPHLGEHERGFRFRTSLQPAFWRRDDLLGLLRPDESPWDFERDATRRSDDLDAPFFVARWRALPFIEALRGGRWYPRTLRLCRRENLAVDLTARGVLSTRQRLAWAGLHLRLTFSGPFSVRLRRFFRRSPPTRPPGRSR